MERSIKKVSYKVGKNTPKLRIRFSLKNLSYQDGLLNIPHFMSDYTKEIIKFILND